MPPETTLTKARAAVTLAGVSRRFPARRRGTGPVEALAGVDLTVGTGEVVAVVGPSGCGKSTLLEMVCGLQAPDAGTVAAEPAALMAQRALLLPWADALDNAALALRAQGTARGPARERAHALLDTFGLAGFERARPAELSGGMRQRVAFARTLLTGRPVLCLDEPFGALDTITRHELQGWLVGALAREPRTVLLVTHDVEEALLLADRVAVLSPRPGRVLDTIAVDLPHPRHRDDTEIVRLRARAHRALGMPT